MSAFDIYVFVLCLIVFLLLGGVTTAMLVHIYKLTGRLIDTGADDDVIKIEYQKKAKAKNARLSVILDRSVSAVLLVILCAVFAFSVYLHATEDKNPNGIPSLKVVKSPSMSYIHEENKILEYMGIDNQIQTYDLILTHHLPDEMDLQLYDIVLYESNGINIIHRIVDIEEPNANHPDCRHFMLQGDANEYPDRIPVYYSQMKGIYKNERVPFVGSFVLFMQSPAGWICIIYVLIASFAAPIMEKKLQRKKDARLALIGAFTPDTSLIGAEPLEAVAVSAPAIVLGYKRSFMARLIQADADVQDYYTAVKNALLSYKGVRARASWNYESFSKGRVQCAKISIKGKTLSLYLALSPVEYSVAKYHFTDASKSAKFSSVPMMLKIKSDRALKYAIELIGEVMKASGIEAGSQQSIDYRMPYETTEALAERNLVKTVAQSKFFTVKGDGEGV